MNPSARKPAEQNSWLVLWLLFLCICNVLGWALSGFHSLTGTAYFIAFLLFALLVILMRRHLLPSLSFRRCAIKCRRRFSRLFPLSFLVMAILAFAGGALYAPSNFDALAYRTPRVLHWLAEHRWHWIHTEFPRLNVRGCGMEWVTAPLIAWTKTDRWLFLINFLSFCCLPGLFFSIFRRLGVSRRTAYAWMWIFPGTYGFVLQAGSIGNDMFGAFVVFAAVHFALIAAQERSVGTMWLSILACGLLTGVKANNMPLALACIVPLIPAWRLVLSRPIVTLAVVLVAASISFVPIAIANQVKTRDWTGLKSEHAFFNPEAPFWARPFGNLVIISMHSVMPPVAPFARTWNERVAPKILPPKIDAEVTSGFMGLSTVWTIPELEIEESAGLGMGVTFLLIGSIVLALRAQRPGPTRPSNSYALPVWAAVLAGFAVFMKTSHVESTARLATAYYPLLLFPLLLLRGQERVVKSRIFRAGTILATALAALLLILSPARPLFPTQTMVDCARNHGLSEGLIKRAERVYTVYRRRSDAFKPALNELPAGIKVLGMITFDDPEATIWRPFGSKKVIHVCTDDGPDIMRTDGIQYIWVHESVYNRLWTIPFNQWLHKMDGRVIKELTLDLRASVPDDKWQLVKLD